MASARCYTKSGGVEKYESECFSGVINHYPNNFISKMTEPDSNGNYSITYNGYDDGDSSNYDCYCETIYGDWRNGGGVKKTFYFKKKNTTVNGKITLYLSVRNSVNPGKIEFGCNVSASPSFTGGNFRVTLIFDYQENDMFGNLSSYTKSLSYTITSSSDKFSDEVNLHNNGGALHRYSLRSVSPTTVDVNGNKYEIITEGNQG